MKLNNVNESPSTLSLCMFFICVFFAFFPPSILNVRYFTPFLILQLNPFMSVSLSPSSLYFYGSLWPDGFVLVMLGFLCCHSNWVAFECQPFYIVLPAKVPEESACSEKTQVNTMNSVSVFHSATGIPTGAPGEAPTIPGKPLSPSGRDGVQCSPGKHLLPNKMKSGSR